MPFHEGRTWQVQPIGTARDLALKLREMTWCCCQGWEHGNYLFLNDATCPDGNQEYAVLRAVPNDRYIKIESLTVNWYESEEKLCKDIEDILNGVYDSADWARPANKIRLERPEVHGRAGGKSCQHCD
jgi:hypothetical protein